MQLFKTVPFVALIPLCFTFAYALNPTPIRVAVVSEDVLDTGKICSKNETITYGLDFGLLTAATCKVYGVQLSPFVSGAEKLKGIQISGVSDAKKGAGVQFGIAFSYANTEFNGLQISGLGNNCSSKRGVSDGAGIEIAAACNMAGNFKGVQVAVLNYAQEHSGLQIGGFNIIDNYQSKSYSVQFGGINKNENISGVQIGVYNSAEKLVGLQVGIVNKAVRARGLQVGIINIISRGQGNYTLTPLPFTPLINASW